MNANQHPPPAAQHSGSVPAAPPLSAAGALCDVLMPAPPDNQQCQIAVQNRRTRPAVLHPNLYVWFVFLAAMDIFGTYLILNPATFPARLLAMAATAEGDLIAWHHEAAGRELNPLADWLIQRGGVPAKVAYKFFLVILVIAVCEFVGRRRPAAGRRLAEWAVALTSIPVVVALVQLAYHAWSLL